MEGFNGTPGKWAVGMDGEILSDAGYIVMGTDLVHGNENDLELIAAAPELLEALQACEKILSEIPLTVDLVEDLLFSRAAISKALGK